MEKFVIITITALWERCRTYPITWSGYIYGVSPSIIYNEAFSKAKDKWFKRWGYINNNGYVVDFYYTST